jgi:hypothetical protein
MVGVRGLGLAGRICNGDWAPGQPPLLDVTRDGRDPGVRPDDSGRHGGPFACADGSPCNPPKPFTSGSRSATASIRRCPAVTSPPGRWCQYPGAAARAHRLPDRQLRPALLDAVQTPPVFTLAKPVSEVALQNLIGQAVVAWPDKSPPVTSLLSASHYDPHFIITIRRPDNACPLDVPEYI